MAFISTKNDIKVFPFQEYNGLSEVEREKKAEAQCLTAHNSWMLPQMLAFFGSFKAVRQEDGLFSPLQILKDNIGNDPWAQGLYIVVTRLKRSSLVKAQIAAAFTDYSALTPLILAGLKKYKSIKYSEYIREELQHIMDKNLYDAMTCEYDPISRDRLLDLREIGLTTQTGPKAGQVSNPLSKWCPTGVKHTEIGELPKLAQTMLTQIWVAHPSIRSSLAVLDPKNWDEMPEPLMSDAPLATKNTKEVIVEKMPWM